MSMGRMGAEWDMGEERGSTMVGYQRYVKFLLGLSGLFLFGCATIGPSSYSKDEATEIVDLNLADAWQLAKVATACERCNVTNEVIHSSRTTKLLVRGVLKHHESMLLNYVDATHTELQVFVWSDSEYGPPNAKAVLEKFRIAREQWAKGELVPPADLPLTATAVTEYPSPTTGYVPLIDPASITDLSVYQRDIAECGQLARANTVRDQAIDAGVGSAMAGAGFGALLSHILGGSAGRGAATGALTWGTVGVGAGAVAQETTYQTIYRNCMTGRGWHVLR